MEYRLAVNFVEDSDFHEGLTTRCLKNVQKVQFHLNLLISPTTGVRALLITKDNNPKWNPARIEDVTEERVKSFFRPLPNNEDLSM